MSHIAKEFSIQSKRQANSRYLCSLPKKRYKNTRKAGVCMEDRQTGTSAHRLSLNGRKKALVTGVKDVLSFDANEVLLETDMGILMLRGDDLHVNRLSLEKGEVDIEGHVDSMNYSDTGTLGTKEGSFFGRIFR